MTTFEAFPKIRRYEHGHCTITEKLDGSNAAIIINDDGVSAQSRNRLLSVGKSNDNFGFAGWVQQNADELAEFFGPGRHFGEWFGIGIQRGYAMRERCFAPFNTLTFPQAHVEAGAPDGVTYTPVLWQGPLTDLAVGVETSMDMLRMYGSHTKPGQGYPAEGAMIHCNTFGYLKVPFEGAHKWQLEAAA